MNDKPNYDRKPGLPVDDDIAVLDAMRSCCMATASAMKKPTKANVKFEERCYRDLFRLAMGRKPNAEELAHITGGDCLRGMAG